GGLISALFPATESQGIFPSPAWLKVRVGQKPGRCPSGGFGSGYAGLGNMRASTIRITHHITPLSGSVNVLRERRCTDQPGTTPPGQMS
ncbi:MAG: hypothetical protein QHJ82_02530, partial [Verrucomicrobiota bacterium]|nr:hypothetical protein [Verrucomicrobiota bacterium]